MIRGYVAFVDKNSPLPAVPPLTALYRKEAVKLYVTALWDHTECKEEFFISVVKSYHNFKVMQNVRTVDKVNIANGIVRVGFIEPDLDVVISCNPEELKVFIDTVEAVQNITPRWCSRAEISHICVNDLGEHPGMQEMFCSTCVNRIICNSHNGDDLTADCQVQTLRGLSVISYPFLHTINASDIGLVQIPEALGSLPCLSYLDLSKNQLGKASNWDWLRSPLLKENLRILILDENGLSSVPEGIVRLKKLDFLSLSQNYLTELPVALGKLQYLRNLIIRNNQLEILPTWVYRRKRFINFNTIENPFSNSIDIEWMSKNELRHFQPKHFISVPPLFEIVAKAMITRRFPFWEYNIPYKLAEYLEGAYYCYCGSLVFNDTGGQIARCRIPAGIFCVSSFSRARNDDHLVAIDVRFCSYECYKLGQRFIV